MSVHSHGAECCFSNWQATELYFSAGASATAKARAEARPAAVSAGG
jgi:hypothetical protein